MADEKIPKNKRMVAKISKLLVPPAMSEVQEKPTMAAVSMILLFQFLDSADMNMFDEL